MGVKLIDGEMKPEKSFDLIHGFFQRVRAGLAVRKETLERAEQLALVDIEKLAARAYCRPLRPEAGFRRLYRASSETGARPRGSCSGCTFAAVLMSPHFFYRIPNAPAGVGRCRCPTSLSPGGSSYFLWSSLPDEDLLKAAHDGEAAVTKPSSRPRSGGDDARSEDRKSFASGAVRAMAPLSRFPRHRSDPRRHLPRLRCRSSASDVRGADPAHHPPDSRRPEDRRTPAQRCDFRQRDARQVLRRRDRNAVPKTASRRSKGGLVSSGGDAEHRPRRAVRDAGDPVEELGVAMDSPVKRGFWVACITCSARALPRRRRPTMPTLPKTEKESTPGRSGEMLAQHTTLDNGRGAMCNFSTALGLSYGRLRRGRPGTGTKDRRPKIESIGPLPWREKPRRHQRPDRLCRKESNRGVRAATSAGRFSVTLWAWSDAALGSAARRGDAEQVARRGTSSRCCSRPSCRSPQFRRRQRADRDFESASRWAMWAAVFQLAFFGRTNDDFGQTEEGKLENLPPRKIGRLKPRSIR